MNYFEDLCIHHLFEAQVERSPKAVAAVFEQEYLTYSELNQRANRLAHHLQALGVGPEVLVGIYVERSLEMLVGILGILKAGGAYVPLDSSYPHSHIAFILEDTKVPVLLTQQRLVELQESANGPEKLHSIAPHGAHVVCLDTDWGLRVKARTSRQTGLYFRAAEVVERAS